MDKDSIDLESAADVRFTKPLVKRFWLGFILFIVAVNIVIIIYPLLESHQTPKKVLNQDWIRDTYGYNGLSIETPERLYPIHLAYEVHIKKMIDVESMFSYQTRTGMEVLAGSIDYKQKIGELNLKGSAQQCIQSIRNSKGVTDLNYKEQDIILDSISGFYQEGTYLSDKIPFKFKIVALKSKLTIWNINVFYRSSDKIGEIVAQRIIKSIEIKK